MRFIIFFIFYILSINISAKEMTNIPQITLNNGMKIPQIGFGTYLLHGDVARKSVEAAIKSGYRMVDTAEYYDNEQEVYNGIIDSGIAREEIFIITKISPDTMRNNMVRQALDERLKNFGNNYIDLVLIHYPAEGYIKNTWEIMEEYVRDGKIKAIGVSNFSPNQIEELLKYAKIKPVINQIEINPYITQKENINFLFNVGIQPQSWSPLGMGGLLLQDKTLKELSKKYNKTIAQIVLRWHIQNGLVVIPRSSNPSHIASNIDIFDFKLSAEDMALIDGLNKKKIADYRNYTASFLW